VPAASPFDVVAGGIDIPSELFPHTLDRVERESAAGRDASGAEVRQWVTVYTDVQALVTNPSTGDVLAWAQRQIVATHKVWVCQQPIGSGNLPRMGVRDRLTFGTRPDGSPRYLVVQWAENLAEADLVLEVDAQEVIPG
jgi:hypothetical protein